MDYNIKETVRIRFKEMKGGKKSIYLDIYENGQRRYDFLKLYLLPETSAKNVQANKRTLELVQTIKAKRVLDVQRNSELYFDTKMSEKESFIEFMRQQYHRHINKGSSQYAQSVKNTINHLIIYAGEDLPFKKITRKFLLGFVSYLDTTTSRFGKPLAQSSKYSYFNNVVIALNRAVKEGYIASNPAHNIMPEDKPKFTAGKREFLTLDEVKLLAVTPCENEIVKKAFLFSCFSGLRISDIRALRWSDIADMGGGRFQVRVQQQKTKANVNIPLSANALAHLPEKNGDFVFPLPMTWVVEKYLALWCKAAGINKHITYHCSRHTHATLLLTYGADIYTVSKLLGHARVQTTEIYAKIIDEKKCAAVDMIPSI